MEKVLEGPTSGPLLNRVEALLTRLAKTAHSTFAEFEDAVSHNSNRHIVHDGTVHPLTAYVINYVKVRPAAATAAPRGSVACMQRSSKRCGVCVCVCV